MNSVAMNRVATNLSKSFGTKEKAPSNVFDMILGKTMTSNRNSKINESSYNESFKPENNAKEYTIDKLEHSNEQPLVKVDKETKTNKSEAFINNQSELKTEYDEESIKNTVKDALKKISESLGVSDEELSEILSVLNLSFTDLFTKEGLDKLLGKVFNIVDEVSLLTNSNAFEAFKDIKLILENVLSTLEMDSETFQKAYEEIKLNLQLNNVNEEAEEKYYVNEKVSNEDITKPHVEVVDNRTIHKNSEPEITKQDAASANEKMNGIINDENNIINDKNSNSSGDGQKNDSNNNLLNHFENVLSHTVAHKFEVVSGNGIEETVIYETTAKDILSQITTQVKVAFTDEATTMFLQLQPENLGKVAFSVKSLNGMLAGSFVAENHSVKEIIEQNLATLKANLEQQGIKLDEVKVVVGNTNQFFNKSDQEKAFNHGFHKGKRKRHADDKVENVEQANLHVKTETILRDIAFEEKSSVEYSA